MLQDIRGKKVSDIILVEGLVVYQNILCVKLLTCHYIRGVKHNGLEMTTCVQ